MDGKKVNLDAGKLHCGEQSPDALKVLRVWPLPCVSRKCTLELLLTCCPASRLLLQSQPPSFHATTMTNYKGSGQPGTPHCVPGTSDCPKLQHCLAPKRAWREGKTGNKREALGPEQRKEFRAGARKDIWQPDSSP